MTSAAAALRILGLVALLVPVFGFAATCTSTKNGNWDNSGGSGIMWTGAGCGGTGNGPPAAGDDVIIVNTDTATIPTGVAAVAQTVRIGSLPAANNSAVLTLAGTATLTVSGGVSIVGSNNSTQSLNVASGTVSMASLTLDNTANTARVVRITFTTGTMNVAGDITFANANTNVQIVFVGAGTLNVGGHLPSGVTLTRATGTVNFNGTGAQNIGAYTYNNLSVTKSSGTATLLNTVTLNPGAAGATNGVLSVTCPATCSTVSPGTLDLAGFTADRSAGGASINVGAGAVLKIGGTQTFPANYTAHNLNATSTVDYSGTSQTVTNETYGNLTLSGSGTKTMPGAALTVATDFNMSGSAAATTLNTLSVGQDFIQAGTSSFTAGAAVSVTRDMTLGSGTSFSAASFTHDVARNFSNNGATFTAGTSRFNFNGSSAQVIGGTSATTFNNLTVANTSGGLSITQDTTVAGTAAGALNLGSGEVTTGTKVLIASGNCNTATVSRTSGLVNGLLRKTVPTSVGSFSCNYEVGTSTTYAPMQVTFPSVSVAGTLTVSNVLGQHPDNASPAFTIDSGKDVNRYWIATNSATVFPSYDASWTYASGDVLGGADPAIFGIGKADSCNGSLQSCTWTYPTIVGTPTSTNAQASGMTSFSSFVVGRNVRSFSVTNPGTQGQYGVFNVTVTALDQAGNTAQNFTGTVDITASGCTLSSGGGTSGNFVSGQLTISVSVSTTTNCTIIATRTGGTETGNSGSFTVTPTTFNAFETSTGAAAIAGNIQTKVAGSGFTLSIVAISNGAKLTSFHNLTVNLDLLQNTGTAGAGYGADNCPTANNVLQSTTLTIMNGRSDKAFAAESNVYRDVRVRISYPTVASTTVVCSGDSFAIRPSGFTIAVTDADWQTAGTGRTLNNTTAASGGTVHKAGTPGSPRPFTITATALPVTASNYNGAITVATVGGVACRTDFGLGGCTSGSVSLGGLTASGTTATTNSANYTEAGSFDLLLEDVDFASIDSSDGSSYTVPQTGGTVAVGRFVPDRFEFTGANTPQLQTFGAACAGVRSFTYIGQPFWFTAATLPSATVQAVNAAGTVTTNYRGALFKLTAADITETYSNNAVGTALAPSANTPVQLTAGNGTGTYTAKTNGTLTYTRNNATPDAAFSANVSLTVSASDPTDAGAGNGTIGTGTPLVFNGGGGGILFDSGNLFRYGRLRLVPATGTATVNLRAGIRTEYWNGTGFVTNAADNCTTLDRTNIALGSYAKNLNACETRSINATGGATISFSGGVGGLYLEKPGATNVGSVLLTADLGSSSSGDFCATIGGAAAATTPASKSYLQGAWNGSATYDKDPQARLSFGVFGGQPNQIIFMRERY